jgi:hypothetical protein
MPRHPVGRLAPTGAGTSAVVRGGPAAGAEAQEATLKDGEVSQIGEDPSRPEFEAAQPDVHATPPQRARDHPLAEMLRKQSYPVSKEELVAAAEDDPALDPEVRRWLEAVLPPGRYDGAEDVERAIGRAGMGPPTSPGRL